MAVRQVTETDSLDKLRIEFNALASSDFGDIATLDPTLSATSVIGAVNEINAIAIALQRMPRARRARAAWHVLATATPKPENTQLPVSWLP